MESNVCSYPFLARQDVSEHPKRIMLWKTTCSSSIIRYHRPSCQVKPWSNLQWEGIHTNSPTQLSGNQRQQQENSWMPACWLSGLTPLNEHAIVRTCTSVKKVLENHTGLGVGYTTCPLTYVLGCVGSGHNFSCYLSISSALKTAGDFSLTLPISWWFSRGSRLATNILSLKCLASTTEIRPFVCSLADTPLDTSPRAHILMNREVLLCCAILVEQVFHTQYFLTEHCRK
jgi:hypothetical protein